VLLARVAVPVPLGRAFTYVVPAALAADVRSGARVSCDFGRRRVLGIVLEVGEREPEIAADKLKPIRAVIDPEPVLPEELLAFLRELARYYLAPVGEVMRLALPAVERSASRALENEIDATGAHAVGRMVRVVRALPDLPPERALALRGQAREIYEHLVQAGPAPLSELAGRWGNARAAARKLESAGAAVVEQRLGAIDPYLGGEIARDQPPALTDPQQLAVSAITRSLEQREARAFLLQGVTASGKTEVYLRGVERCLELGGGAIVLVPEIALTPQLAARFRARLGDRIAVLHSGLGDRERHAMWKALRAGELRVAVGARSALFAPVQKLALLCVDEEHDGSFKQEEGVRYHARDMAILRAHRAGATALLGSATPSLASIALVRAGKLERLRLPERAHHAAALPSVELVDLRRVGAGKAGHKLLSLPLERGIERVLERGEQAILFLNRRGFAPSLLCEACGQIAQCPHCSVALTLHRRGGERLRCHYCDYSRPLPRTCQACGSSRISDEGSGTERIEATLAEAFPTARIARLDRDVAPGAKSERVLDQMRRREVDIMVGTQMVTKGHDLPGVTLVGVLNADAALSMPDFRAAERTFHLLVQVAGRAGRGDVAGRVMIQTWQPDHPAVRMSATHDVDGFIEHELRDREELGYPPFSRIALVRIDALDERAAELAAGRLARIARAAAPPGVDLLGPAPAPIARIRNRFRWHFMLRAPERAALRPVLLAVARARPDRRVRVGLDVDPMTML
jgi:primosomal protein N' (replication factor Y) (superfamily II helicase)